MTSGKHKRVTKVIFKSKIVLLLASTALLISQLIFVQTPVNAVTVGSGSCATQVNDSTGVTVTSTASECIITFTSTTTNYVWSTPVGIGSAKVVVVGGGGGGGDSDSVGRYTGGGGGAGGFFKSDSVTVTGDIDIYVGAGGAGATSSTTKGSQGGDSAFGALKVGGGGGGNSYLNSGSAALSGTGGATYVSGGGGGGGRASRGTLDASKNSAPGGAASTVSFLNVNYTGIAGEPGSESGRDNQTGGLGGSISEASRTSSITDSSVIYAKSSVYTPWSSSQDSNQTYGSGGSPNYNYGNAETSGNELGGAGAQGVVIVSWVIPTYILGTNSGDECAQTGTNITGSVVREGDYCLVAIKGPTVTTGSSGSWSVPNGVIAIEYLIVGGGGGGGIYSGGGAGAFYETTAPAIVSARDSIEVTIGSGGQGATSRSVAGSNGANSSFNGVTSYGGGGGATLTSESVPNSAVVTSNNFGGSGGGAITAVKSAVATSLAYNTANTSFLPISTVNGGQADVDLANGNGLSRFPGGLAKQIFVSMSDKQKNLSFAIGSGGGGAGGPGGDVIWETQGTGATTRVAPGAGGIGKVSQLITSASSGTLGIGEIDGSSVYFAGGGGAGLNFLATSFDHVNALLYVNANVGGLGGGGNSHKNAITSTPNTVDALANSGGGGSGGAIGGTLGFRGGSGVVLIRYTIPQVLSVSASNASTTEVDLTWTRPARGVETITGYVIEKSLKGANNWTNATTETISSPNSANGAKVTGLSVNTEYDFRVTPVFASGNGVVSALVSSATLRNTQTVSWSPGNTSVLTTASPLSPSSLATTNGDGGITYSVQSAGSTGCTVNATTAVLTFSTAGSCVVRASAAQTSNYASAYKDVTFTIASPTATSTPTPTAEPTTNSSPSATPTPTPSATKQTTTTKKKTTKPSTNNSTQNPINTVQPTPTPTPSKSATSIPMNSQSATPAPVVPKSEFKQLENAPYPGSGLTKPIAGEIVAALNGERIEASVITTAIDTKVEITPDQSVVLFTQSQLGESLPLTEAGVIEVKDETKVFAEVTGFGKNTPVEVWVFSTPIRLGGGYTNETGDFTGQFKLDSNLPAGNHTLQLNGLDGDGNLVTVAIGMVKKNSESPQATVDAASMTWFEQTSGVVFGAIIFGLILLLIRRRRREEAN